MITNSVPGSLHFLPSEKFKCFCPLLYAGIASRLETCMTPRMPAQVTRVAAISSPAVTFMATNLVDQTLAGVFMFHYTDYPAKAYVVYLHTFQPNCFLRCRVMKKPCANRSILN